MKTIRIETNFENPKPIQSKNKWVWETSATTAQKAVNNVRAQIHKTLDVPFHAIKTAYWQVVETF